MHFRHRQTRYHLTVLRTREGDGVPTLTVDGVMLPAQTVALVDDCREHLIVLALHAGRSERAGTGYPSVVMKGEL